MPFIHVAWLPKACRTPEIRKEVAAAIIRAVTAVDGAQITPDKVVVRFSEVRRVPPIRRLHARVAIPQSIARAFFLDASFCSEPRPPNPDPRTPSPTPTLTLFPLFRHIK